MNWCLAGCAIVGIYDKLVEGASIGQLKSIKLDSFVRG